MEKNLQERILKKDWQGAIILCDRLQELQPDNHELYIAKGDAFMGMQNYHKAAEVYQILLEADFSDGENNQWKERLDLCNQILDVDGNFVFIYTIIIVI